MINRLLIMIFLTAVHFACSTKSVVSDDASSKPLSDGEYKSLIADHTTSTNRYSGIYQTFQGDMTILNSTVRAAIVQRRSDFLQWDNKRYQQEREKAFQEMSAFATFFLRYYSPENDYDDLHKPNTIWKVYLEFNGQRYEGKVKKLTDKLIEVQRIYPRFDRFSTPYEITFNIPMSSVEQASCRVTLTSSLATSVFEFAAVKGSR